MKRRNLYILTAIFSLIFLFSFYWIFISSPKERPATISETQSVSPAIFPDYKEVTIPCNIAPLNFRIDVPVEKSFLQITNQHGDIAEFYGTDKICFPEDEWKTLLNENSGKSLSLSIAPMKNGQWTQWAPFKIHISKQTIDSHLVYRLIEPGYEKWHIIGIINGIWNLSKKHLLYATT